MFKKLLSKVAMLNWYGYTMQLTIYRYIAWIRWNHLEHFKKRTRHWIKRKSYDSSMCTVLLYDRCYVCSTAEYRTIRTYIIPTGFLTLIRVMWQCVYRNSFLDKLFLNLLLSMYLCNSQFLRENNFSKNPSNSHL